MHAQAEGRAHESGEGMSPTQPPSVLVHLFDLANMIASHGNGNDLRRARSPFAATASGRGKEAFHFFLLGVVGTDESARLFPVRTTKYVDFANHFREP